MELLVVSPTSNLENRSKDNEGNMSETSAVISVNGGVETQVEANVPVGTDPLAHPEQWALGVSTFKVE